MPATSIQHFRTAFNLDRSVVKPCITHLSALLLLLFFFAEAGVSYAQSPSWQWGKRGGTPSTLGENGEDRVIDMATDPNGNVYVLANDKRGSTPNVDGHEGLGPYDRISVASWNCDGVFRWMKSFGGGAYLDATALRLDTLGGVYISGALVNASGSAGPGGLTYFDTDTVLPFTDKSMFLIKYDTTGMLQWLKMPQPDTISIANANLGGIYDMDVSPNGDAFLYCLLTPGGYDENAFVVADRKMYVLRYNANGVFQNMTPMDISVSGTVQQGYGYANLGGTNRKFSRDHHNGRYYLTGHYNSDLGTLTFGTTPINSAGEAVADPMYLAAFDDAGNNLWVKQSDPDKRSGIFSRPACDNNGTVYIGGAGRPGDSFNGYTFPNSEQNTMPFVIAVDGNGNTVWATTGAVINASYVTALTFVNNTIAVDGFFSGSLIWDGLIATSQTSMSGITSIFLARFNATTGSITGLDSIPSNALNTYPSAIAGDRNSNFYAGGFFADQLYPADDTLTNIGGMYDWFVAKFGSANCNCVIPQPSYAYTNSGSTYSFNYTGNTPYTAISWDFGDGTPSSSTASPAHSYAAAGMYAVCVTVTNNCGSNSFCQQINTDDSGIPVPGAFANISIYPNPVIQVLTLDNATPGTTLDIYNTTGQIVLHTTLTGTTDQIHVGPFPSGLYMMRFTDKEGDQGDRQFVKQ